MNTTQVTNALTIDFEDWYQGLQIPMRSWSRYEDRVVPATERLLAILEEARVGATFFALGFVAERPTEQLNARRDEPNRSSPR